MAVCTDTSEGMQAHRGDVLILTASTGAGHDTVARALQEAIQALAPDVGVQIFDPLSGRRRMVGAHRTGAQPCADTAPLLSAARWYDATVAHVPWLWGLCYHATNNAVAVRLGVAGCALPWAGRLRSAIQAEQPRIVVSVHALCTHLAAGILRTLPDAPPLHCVVTDLVTVHRSWACEAVGAFYVATTDARDALVAMGIPSEHVHLTGLPLRASFAETPHDAAEDATRRVLLLGGGRPSRRIEAIARALLAAGMPMRLVVVCGRNARLRRQLIRAIGARATVLGWRDDMAALMRWSQMVISKGGPTTVAEALSQARPVLISHVHPGQEVGNVALVERHGSGCYVPDDGALVRAVMAVPPAWCTGKATQAAWWGSAARRVAMRLLAARADQTIDRRHPAYGADEPATSGRVIENPISGERIVIRESGAESGGQLLAFDLFLPPGAHVPARHAHPVQEEQFTVLAGQMRFRLGRRRRTILANPGDTVRVPAGTAHWFGNAGVGTSHARVEVRPALRMEELFESAAAMNVTRLIPGARMPRLSELSLFLSEFQRELVVPEVPAFLVRAALAPFAWLGRRERHAKPGQEHGAG